MGGWVRVSVCEWVRVWVSEWVSDRVSECEPLLKTFPYKCTCNVLGTMLFACNLVQVIHTQHRFIKWFYVMLNSAEHEFFFRISVKMPTIVGILTFVSRKKCILGLFEPGLYIIRIKMIKIYNLKYGEPQTTLLIHTVWPESFLFIFTIYTTKCLPSAAVPTKLIYPTANLSLSLRWKAFFILWFGGFNRLIIN